MKPKYVIIAPHADDEIIGCYELLVTGKVDTVAFPNNDIIEEAIESSEFFGFNIETIEDVLINLTPNMVLLFPDPYFELHPEHRRWGSIGLDLARKGQKVIFYTTSMNSPYLREAAQPGKKKDVLDTIYPKKSDLWKYDHKYFLFEGQLQWIMTWDD